jgi:hypothetical protein
MKGQGGGEGESKGMEEGSEGVMPNRVDMIEVTKERERGGKKGKGRQEKTTREGRQEKEDRRKKTREGRNE